MAKLRVGAHEMTARIGGDPVIVHPFALDHMTH
jgi:hypothetical protein